MVLYREGRRRRSILSRHNQASRRPSQGMLDKSPPAEHISPQSELGTEEKKDVSFAIPSFDPASLLEALPFFQHDNSRNDAEKSASEVGKDNRDTNEGREEVEDPMQSIQVYPTVTHLDEKHAEIAAEERGKIIDTPGSVEKSESSEAEEPSQSLFLVPVGNRPKHVRRVSFFEQNTSVETARDQHQNHWSDLVSEQSKTPAASDYHQTDEKEKQLVSVFKMHTLETIEELEYSDESTQEPESEQTDDVSFQSHETPAQLVSSFSELTEGECSSLVYSVSDSSGNYSTESVVDFPDILQANTDKISEIHRIATRSSRGSSMPQRRRDHRKTDQTDDRSLSEWSLNLDILWEQSDETDEDTMSNDPSPPVYEIDDDLFSASTMTSSVSMSTRLSSLTSIADMSDTASIDTTLDTLPGSLNDDDESAYRASDAHASLIESFVASLPRKIMHAVTEWKGLEWLRTCLK